MDISSFYQKSAFDWIKQNVEDPAKRLALIGDMLRHNSIAQVFCAQTGHIGASLSAADILAALYHELLHLDPQHPQDKERDIFILSKGHASSLAYAALASRGFFPDPELLRFRRHGGLQGHVDMQTPGIDANTGSLGMGISKAKGHAWAMKQKGLAQRAYVMTGDGEMQEGQNWEALQSAPSMGLGNLILLLDQNTVQTDLPVDSILHMPPVEKKLEAFGWEVHIIDGHDLTQIITTLQQLDDANEKPKAIICKTIKGKGVDFMEHPTVLKNGIYVWHNKVPSLQEFTDASNHIKHRLETQLGSLHPDQSFWPQLPTEAPKPATTWEDDFVVRGYTKALMELCPMHPELIVIDGDLAIDCGVRAIEQNFPKNWLELGIAEQDMVSTASGLAHQGYLPIINTFSAFLSSRSNEQIFNAQTEDARIIYAGHLAGLIPATPGKSHQAIRDIGLLRNLPNLTICEPANEQEAELATKYCVEQLSQSVYLRFANCKSLRRITLPSNYIFELGKGCVLREGKTLSLISAGPIMLSQCLDAADILSKNGFETQVINLPWHTHIDANWLASITKETPQLFVVDNHGQSGGQSDEIRRISRLHPELSQKQINSLSIEGFAETGYPLEVLKAFHLDGASIAEKIAQILKNINS